jgi:hypothetical protein
MKLVLWHKQQALYELQQLMTAKALALHPDMLARAVCRADRVSLRVVVGRSTRGAFACQLRPSCTPFVADGLAVRLSGRIR